MIEGSINETATSVNRQIMRKIQLSVGLLLLTAALSVPVLAGDYAQLNFIGFSKDGKYLAFEEFGMSVPEMKGYSTIYFVDTAKNAYAAPSVSSSIEDSEMDTYDYSFDSAARRRALAKAGPVLKRLGIVMGNTGRQVISRPLTDVTDESAPPYEPKSVVFAPDRRQSMLNGRFYLTLRSVAANQVCKAAEDPELVEYVGAGGIPFPKITENPNRKTSDKEKQKLYSFELALKIGDADKTIVLQKAISPPAERGCSIDHRIEAVNLYKNQIAVFIGVFTPGFLGDDVRLKVVTGKIGADNDR